MIVTQCWDDGVVDDIRVADILRKYKAKATFNLNPGLYKKKRDFGWTFNSPKGFVKDVYRLGTDDFKHTYAGFDIAGHSMTHPRPPAIPLDVWRGEVADCKKWLEDFFGFEVRGFAYPFGQYSDPVKEIVRECGHTYARTVEYTDHPFPPADPMALASHCHFLSPDFMTKFEAVRAEDGIFYFWGHTYEIASEPMWDEFENTIKVLSESPGVKWEFLADLI